ncbi:hypothetical protein ACFVXE_22955 [Streptomyces sp. NPDC058231]|uniref:hypothetical protein n=1 Tax=Streptomyces sp. NPDC058231 TaxID=3346392 RepID=UPI0036ED97E9
MGPHRRVTRRATVALAAGVGAALLAGCGTGGGLRSAGRAPSAVGPARLWPQLPPASAAPYDYGEGATARIPGIEVPHDDVREVDPVAVVQAGLKATTSRSSGTDELPAGTVRKITACRTAPAGCPVLRPYFRDLTGDGRDDMVLGIRRSDGRLSVRVYMADGGALTRIMAVSDAVISVELAGPDVIMRVPSAIAGYEYRTAWSWDGRQRAMLPAQDEILRMIPHPELSARPSADATARPSTVPSSAAASAGRR